MSDTFVINTPEQLEKFRNDKGFVELVERGKHNRIKAIHKVFMNELPQAQEKEAMEKVVDELRKAVMKNLNKNSIMSAKNLKLLGQIANAQKIGLLLNGMNLCATCVGFAIMYKKLDEMSAELGQQIDQLKSLVKQGNDVQKEFELNKVLADHQDMLDCRRKGHPYTEEKMRDLVDREYNVLTMLINVMMKDITADKQSTVFSVFSLLSMFTVCLRFFDEVYYENNHAVLGDKAAWHSSHDKWTSVYSTLTSTEFIEKLQDYAVFETNLDTTGVDIFCTELLDQVVEQREEVSDNQELITILGSTSLLQTLRDITDQEIKETISEAFAEAVGENPSDEVQKIFDDVMSQMALA